jgi:hypothetical protein
VLNSDSGTTPVLTLESDSDGFVSQAWTHYQSTGDYERSDRIIAEFAGDDAYHATDRGRLFARKPLIILTRSNTAFMATGHTAFHD